MGLFSKIFGTYSEKEVKRVMPIVDKINGLEPEISKLSDEELTGKTQEFKKRLNEGETLDDILPEAFAVVREASKRVLGMRHFDVQLIGGIILHQGRIAEMKTGEGKTLVATLPVYLNALTGKGVHVVTVNDYLAKRDSEWMGKLYKFLGLSVGLVIAGMNSEQKQKAYNSDITYGTNNEYGFDYLRDNMVIYKNDMVQRPLNYAIVDEIDSILIDEARTPLIISGTAAESSVLYSQADDFVKRLKSKVLVEEDIKRSDEKGQPVLVGTVSIEKSEKLSSILKREGIKHEVLNAKYHEREAQIIAQAGKFGAVTIATNMAGRGTDIMLGGNSEFLAKQEMKKQGFSEELIEQSTTHNETEDEEILKARETFSKLEQRFDNEIKEEKQKVVDAGGLKIIGTERHESRRIDNQLRGRSGRQGDPGESRFYIALDDDLMKIFGGDMVTSVYNTLGADENMPLEMGILSRAVESAQKKVEGKNFSIRKHVLQYDDVMNTQRGIIYKQRKQVLDGENIHENILHMINSVAEETIQEYVGNGEDVNKEGLLQEIKTIFNVNDLESLSKKHLDVQEITDELKEKALQNYDKKAEEIGQNEIGEVERVVMLKVVDQKWMDHIDAMDELKDGIGLRAYGQKDPVVQYRIEGFDMFDKMVNDIKHDVVKILLNINRVNNVERKQTIKITSQGLEQAVNALKNSTPQESKEVSHIPVTNEGPKVGRNDPCPCRQPVKNIKIVVVNNVLKKGE